MQYPYHSAKCAGQCLPRTGSHNHSDLLKPHLSMHMDAISVSSHEMRGSVPVKDRTSYPPRRVDVVFQDLDIRLRFHSSDSAGQIIGTETFMDAQEEIMFVMVHVSCSSTTTSPNELLLAPLLPNWWSRLAPLPQLHAPARGVAQASASGSVARTFTRTCAVSMTVGLTGRHIGEVVFVFHFVAR